jgi:acyl-CoA oxidase
MEWRDEIRKVSGEAEKRTSLVDIGIQLAHLHGNGKTGEVLAAAKPTLTNIETTLGLISYEAVYALQGTHDTITSGQATRETFDVATMSKLLY